jgi:hypothetical protein
MIEDVLISSWNLCPVSRRDISEAGVASCDNGAITAVRANMNDYTLQAHFSINT